ncbi:DUF465 domain-containing protein [Devosia algicola]|uniref:DUF465 domain-containing protein n=1 Tax=Devosia algicola TaxID=3026418 RepID=UPI003899067C
MKATSLLWSGAIKSLDRQIQSAMQSTQQDALMLSELKRKKLGIKDELSKLTGLARQ